MSSFGGNGRPNFLRDFGDNFCSDFVHISLANSARFEYMTLPTKWKSSRWLLGNWHNESFLLPNEKLIAFIAFRMSPKFTLMYRIALHYNRKRIKIPQT